MSMFTMSTISIGAHETTDGESNNPVKIFEIGKSKNEVKNFTNAVSLMATGGIATIFYAPEQLEALKASSANDPENLEFLSLLEPGVPVIQYDQDLKKVLEPLAFQAILEHEVGHIKNGDLFKGETGLISNEEFEIEADRYAANIHGPKAMMLALKSVYAEYLYPRQKALLGFDKPFKEWMTESVIPMNPMLVKRMSALQELDKA